MTPPNLRKARFVAVTVVVALVVPVQLAASPRTAMAAPDDTQTAEALFQSGKDAMARGDLPTACARFADSVRLDPAAGTWLNLGACEERAGKLASALAHFQAARDRLRADDYRVPYVTERIAALAARAPRLTVTAPAPAPTAEPRGAVVVLRDETPLGAASLGVALPVDPGVHTITVRAPGHAEAKREITLREGEARTVDAALGAPTADAGASTSADAQAAEAEAPSGRTQRAIGVTFGGAGLALLATGTVLGFVARSQYDSARAHCPTGPTSCTPDGVSGGDTAYGEARASTITMIAGGVFVATGLTLYLTAKRNVRLAPSVARAHAGMQIEGAW